MFQLFFKTLKKTKTFITIKTNYGCTWVQHFIWIPSRTKAWLGCENHRSYVWKLIARSKLEVKLWTSLSKRIVVVAMRHLLHLWAIYMILSISSFFGSANPRAWGIMKKRILNDPQDYQCCFNMLVALPKLFSSMIQVRNVDLLQKK